MNKTNTYSTILGGMLAWKSGLSFWIRALEVPFLSTWKWALSPKMAIFRHVANGRQGSPRFKGDPRDGWDELKPDWSYLSHFPPWYSKLGHFPIEIPIKNKKCLHNWGYRSIILKIIFWAPYTIKHAVFRGSTDFWKKKKSFLGHPKVKLSLDGWMKWMGWIMRVRAVASPLSSSQSLPVLPTTTKWSKTVTTLPANWYQVSHKLPFALKIDTLMIIKCC